jgi:uncharacterized protein (DUF4415 family)
MSTKNRKDIQYGYVELDENEFQPQNVKVRVTTMLDEDVLQGLKGIAEEKGVKYQTLLNRIVRSYVFQPRQVYNTQQPLTEEAVRRIVKDELKKKKA